MAEKNLQGIKDNFPVLSRDLVQAEWDSNKKRAFVTKRKGKCMQNVGEIIHGKTVLYPEEALFLMETSVLELHYNGAVQSIQEAYRLLLGEDMALEKFQVYSHLRRLGYIVVRHKKRSDDSAKIECEKQAQSMHGKSSRENIHLREQISQALQNYSNENDRVNEKDFRSDDSADAESRNKTSSHVRCIWKGIDIPNIAGKTFLQLETPSLSLFPKNVYPQKQHYLIDLQASKNEVDYYYSYYEDETENQAYATESQTYNNYYNSEENKNLNPNQYKNASQDTYHFNQTTAESSQRDVPLTNYENTNFPSFSSNAEEQAQSYNSDPHLSQGYAHNVHNNWNEVPSSNYGNNRNSNSCAEHRKQEHSGYNRDNPSYNHYKQSQEANRNCTVSLPNNNYQQFYDKNDRNLESGRFQNASQGYSHSSSYTSEPCHRTLAENVNVTSEEKTNVNYEMCDSSYTYNSSSDQYGKSYKDNRNYGQDQCDSGNLAESLHKSYNESNKDNAYTEELSKHRTYKQRYVEKRNKSYDKNYTNKNKRRKGKKNTEEENSSPFPRVTKVVSCWKEFKHETELQSTAEYLMNGPAKILWNNKFTPLVAPSENLTKETVFGALSIIDSIDGAESCLFQPLPYDKLDFDVYMPTTNYSRYSLELPCHRIKVVRCKDPTPSIGYEGKIPVHYAVVDNGSIVFYSFHNVKLPCYV